jgi:tellurite resistance protein
MYQRLYLQYQPLRTMVSATQKLQILESLNALDATQTEKVLSYIRSLTGTTRDEMRYRQYKREAMKEIRKALRTDRYLRSGK